jgi:hypothetical protein
MKELIKKVLKGNALGRLAYEPIHKMYQLYSSPHRRRMLRKNGVGVLKVLSEIFERRGIPAFAAYGTLLGFVRDNGFLPHDDDIDIGVLPGEWTANKVLRVLLKEESGFSFIHGFTYDGRLTEFTVLYDGLSIDFFFYADEGDKFYAGSYHYLPDVAYPAVNANSAQRVVEPRIEDLGKIHVLGVDFPVPNNTEYVLEKLYGNWRVPDTKWNDNKHPGIEDLPGFAYRITNAEELL